MPGTFDDESEQAGLLFGAHAGVTFTGARKVDHLSEAIASRDLIGQAEGPPAVQVQRA